MRVFIDSEAVFKTNLKQVHDSGEAPELDYIAERNEKCRQIQWFPSVVKIIGEQWLGIPRFSLNVYACESRMGLCYVESEETESFDCSESPRVKIRSQDIKFESTEQEPEEPSE